MDIVVDIESVIRLITNESYILKTMENLSITKNDAKLYLSAYIFYKFPEPSNEYINGIAHSLCELFTKEKLEEYKSNLDYYKKYNALNMNNELENVKTQISAIVSPEKKINELFRRQEQIVSIAHDYFRNLHRQSP